MKTLDLIERRKARGRPFVKGNVKGKPPEENMISEQIEEETLNVLEDIKDVTQIEKVSNVEVFSHPKKTLKKEKKSVELKKEDNPINLSSELIESLDFMLGTDKLSIRLLKTTGRLYKLNVILNDNLEIRPTTFAGSVAGLAFWNLLKGSLDK